MKRDKTSTSLPLVFAMEVRSERLGCAFSERCTKYARPSEVTHVSAPVIREYVILLTVTAMNVCESSHEGDGAV
jgi:hypothetical protein